MKIVIGAGRETEMIADPKRKPHQDDGASDKRRRQEEALDEALENTFPASDPVSAEQPTTSGRACRSSPKDLKDARALWPVAAAIKRTLSHEQRQASTTTHSRRNPNLSGAAAA